MELTRGDVKVKRYIITPFIVYFIVCIVAFLLPVSDSAYNEISWKLFVGQVYAIPVLIVAAVISYYLYRRKTVLK